MWRTLQNKVSTCKHKNSSGLRPPIPNYIYYPLCSSTALLKYNTRTFLTTMAATTTFTREEVATNNNVGSLHVVIDSKVYDLTEFADAHPGGAHVLLQVAGKDASSEFFQMHRHEVLLRYSKLCIGSISGETPQVIEPQPGDLCPIQYSEPQVRISTCVLGKVLSLTLAKVAGARV